MNPPTLQSRPLPWRVARVVAPLCVLLSAVPAAQPENSSPKSVSPKAIRPERELFITAPAVVDSAATQYPGAWSFGTLINELVGEDKAGDCIVDWLAQWRTSQTLNDQLILPRPRIDELVIQPWQKRDGYDPDSGQPWKPNLAHAPFRLLAIVNRMDLCAPDVANTFQDLQTLWTNRGLGAEFLRLTSFTAPDFQLPSVLAKGAGRGYGGGCVQAATDVGEGRLVFGATTPQGQPLPGGWTVIFEYALPGGFPLDVAARQRAQAWHGLAAFDESSPQYATALEQVTRTFTHHALNNGGGGAGPRLNQVRTSEAAFGPDREFRQFKLDQARLVPAPLNQTPAPVFQHRHGREHDALAEFLHERDPLIRSGVHTLPVALPTRHGNTVPLLAATASIPAAEPDFHWEGATNVTREARRIYSLATCNGCHAGETGCRDGLHVHPRESGAAAQLSAFLRMDHQPLRVPDPALRAEWVEFREMDDRATIFAAFLEEKPRERLDGLRDVLRNRLRREH